MTSPQKLPLVAVIATGGTIASRKDARGAARPNLTGQDLLDLLPPLSVRLRAVEILAKDSSSLTLSDMQQISDAVGQQLADPAVCGVVVLHGTDAMEETSLLVHLQHGKGKPVIFTGAQFSADNPKSDGPENLAAAIGTALQGKGVRLVFGERELPAWGLYKAVSDRVDAFRLAGSGVPPMSELPRPVSDLRIDIVALYPGADALHLDASRIAGAQGIVLAALGSGNTTPAVVAGVARAIADDIPVIVSSRVPEGELAPVYGGGGGGHDLRDAGAIHSRLLRPGQARILLAALLANGADRETIAQAFA
ncbi:asparaginase [Paracoccus sp. MBLB3053]|uniref:Asparaginase n=1 Tax=Paracoccus aurantius TaxID=3073814 RepID=A0ABU2HXJ7_9RHOB|nr:asparaginase [Paracoccus sp. MBLB3053]MDS9469039.1 asparaginase [Paracoccus sp. MBLB3053]